MNTVYWDVLVNDKFGEFRKIPKLNNSQNLSHSHHTHTFIRMVASSNRIKPELHFILLKWVW